MNIKKYLIVLAICITCLLTGCEAKKHTKEPETFTTPYYETADRFNYGMTPDDVTEILKNDGHEIYQSSSEVVISETEWYDVTGVLIFVFSEDGSLEFISWGDKNYGDFAQRGITDDWYTTIKAALTLKYGPIQYMEPELEDSVCWKDGLILFESSNEGFSITAFRRDKLCES